MKCCHWNIVFVSDCNLRCDYCATHFGRFHGGDKKMHQEHWPHFISFVRNQSVAGGTVSFEFGGGETFLAFDDFLDLTDRIEDSLNEINCQPKFMVTTNGTLLDEKRLTLLAQRGINLEFSIDGPAEIHDKRRRDLKGIGSFERSINAWRHYRELSRQTPLKPGCSLKSVADPELSLDVLAAFWEAEGQPMFNCAVELPRDFKDPVELSRWRRRQDKYLDDLEQWAFSQAQKLRIPTFLSDYRGPADLFAMWNKLFMESGWGGAPCSVFKSMLAVDTEGNIYPCEGFTGQNEWQVGSIYDGINKQLLDMHSRKLREITSQCKNCSAQDCCPGSCPAGVPGYGLRQSFEDGCSFAMRLAEIARSSYRVMEKRGGGFSK